MPLKFGFSVYKVKEGVYSIKHIELIQFASAYFLETVRSLQKCVLIHSKCLKLTKQILKISSF